MKRFVFLRFVTILSAILLCLFACYFVVVSQNRQEEQQIPIKTFSQSEFIPVPVDDKGDKTFSPYFVVLSSHPETDYLPLKETSANVNIVGVIADVSVKQKYVNSGKNTLEAVYTFPMSTRAAVYGMQMTIGNRTITAKIEEKEKARKDYEKAKSEGRRASLLEQNRPNVFTMNVANIDAGDTIVVEMKYTELLVPENGIYSFAYPTVVGPRYSNKLAEDTLSDDHFVNTPYTKDGVAPVYDFAFDMKINSSVAVYDIASSTHKINVCALNTNTTHVKLDPSESKGANCDVVINYSLQGNKIESGIMTYEGTDENFFLLMAQPPKEVKVQDIPPREYIFIVDVSGSMHGFPLSVSKTLLKDLISNLRSKDKFNVLLFSGGSSLMSPSSINASEENIKKAINFIEKERGGGGTELIQALKTAYAIPQTENNLSRSFVIATDGYVNIEKETFDFIRKNGGNTNFFTFGIGSSVNRYLLEGMAFMGKGEPAIILNEKEAPAKAEKFRQHINTPALTNIKVDYGTFQVYDVEPLAVPDLLAERPIIIYGKYKGKPQGTITVTGKTGSGVYTQTFNLNNVKPDENYSVLRYLWAREQVKMLNYYSKASYHYRDDSSYKKTITDLGLKYNLMTEYTSFIAIDEQYTIENGKRVKVVQPLPLPSGVSELAVDSQDGYMSSSIQFMVPIMPQSELTNIAELKSYEIIQEEEVFVGVEQQPQFPGGEKELMKYIQENLKYPVTDTDVVGRVIIRFVVAKDGSVKDVTVLRGLTPEFDKEAVRVIQSMPKWIPGKQNGMPVAVYYTIPIVFRLQS